MQQHDQMQLAIREETLENEEEQNFEHEDEIQVVYSEEEIASFRSIFDMFDKAGTGEIVMQDFQSIMASLNRTDEEVNLILEEFGFLGGESEKTHLKFEEFIDLMQTLEKKML